MSNLLKKRRRSNLSRKVFKDPRRKQASSIKRQVIESIVMLLAGSALIFFLNWIPQRLYSISILTKSLLVLTNGLKDVFYSSYQLLIILLTACLLLLAFTLLLGGVFRVIRISILTIRRKRKRL